MAYGSNWQKSIYYLSPSWGKTVLSSCYGLFERRQRYGRTFWSTFNDLRRLEYEPNEVLIAHQLRHLKQFLIAARNEVRHYKELFRRCRFSPETLERADQLSELPILNKETVRTLMSDLISRNLPSYSPRWVHTSGTTGKALQFPLSSSCFQREYAFRAQHYSWGKVGLVSREPKAFLAGHPVVKSGSCKPPFWTYDLWNNWLLFSSYHMTEENLRFYVREFERFSPVMIGGYPSSLCLLAAAYHQWGRRTLALRAVYSASETLFAHQRKLIESAFRCKVFVWYGNTEMCGNIVECEQGGFHGQLAHSYMEVLDDSGRPAEEGHLVCTGFGNSAFPLVRYDTGDMVRLARNQHCGCGRAGLLFESVIGRVEDYILTPDGRFVGRLDHLFKDAIQVVEAQLEQSDPTEVIIRIVPRSNYTHQDERRIESEARLRLGPDIRLRFEYVRALKRTAAGKSRFILSTLNANRVLDGNSALRGVFVSSGQNA